jgi:quinol monooxygenase YgiN
LKGGGQSSLIEGSDEFCTERRNNPSEMTSGKDMILATLRMAIPLQKRGEALKILRSMVARSQARPDDCVFCRICEDALEDNTLQFEEMWRSEEELERHLRSDEYHRVLLVLEMALKQPEIRFDTISSSTGIETIEKARSRAK